MKEKDEMTAAEKAELKKTEKAAAEKQAAEDKAAAEKKAADEKAAKTKEDEHSGDALNDDDSETVGEVPDEEPKPLSARESRLANDAEKAEEPEDEEQKRRRLAREESDIARERHRTQRPSYLDSL